MLSESTSWFIRCHRSVTSISHRALCVFKCIMDSGCRACPLCGWVFCIWNARNTQASRWKKCWYCTFLRTTNRLHFIHIVSTFLKWGSVLADFVWRCMGCHLQYVALFLGTKHGCFVATRRCFSCSFLDMKSSGFSSRDTATNSMYFKPKHDLLPTITK